MAALASTRAGQPPARSAGPDRCHHSSSLALGPPVLGAPALGGHSRLSPPLSQPPYPSWPASPALNSHTAEQVTPSSLARPPDTQTVPSEAPRDATLSCPTLPFPLPFGSSARLLTGPTNPSTASSLSPSWY